MLDFRDQILVLYPVYYQYALANVMIIRPHQKISKTWLHQDDSLTHVPTLVHVVPFHKRR